MPRSGTFSGQDTLPPYETSDCATSSPSSFTFHVPDAVHLEEPILHLSKHDCKLVIGNFQ